MICCLTCINALNCSKSMAPSSPVIATSISASLFPASPRHVNRYVRVHGCGHRCGHMSGYGEALRGYSSLSLSSAKSISTFVRVFGHLRTLLSKGQHYFSGRNQQYLNATLFQRPTLLQRANTTRKQPLLKHPHCLKGQHCLRQT